MMNPMMPYGMMGGVPLVWIMIGFLVALLLVAVVSWLLVRWRNEQGFSQTQEAPHSQDSFHPYEQGYQSAEPSPEAYQEGGRPYSYVQPPYEQPVAQYPQEMPLQQ
jgi:flagellar basal body-associated protein FliL